VFFTGKGSEMNERIVVLMMSVVMCASMARGAVTVDSVDNDVDPADPLAWTSSTVSIIGDTGVGVVTVDGGSDLSSRMSFLGNQSTGDGAVTITGVGSTWSIAYSLFIGKYGKGALEITNGGDISSRNTYVGQEYGSNGVVTVSGVGSTWTNTYETRIGIRGEATMDIINGGYVYNELSCRIGDQFGSTGAVTVRGAGSTWTITDGLTIGFTGVGTLDITNGGAVSNTGSGIGGAFDSTGTVTVSGSGSIWSNSFDLNVGFNGVGSLYIDDNALVLAGGMGIDRNEDRGSHITIATGGMLALKNNHASSLSSFLGRINGTDDIRYWDDDAWDWDNISAATPGDDYTLIYHATGDLSGYTVLTVTTAPEPTTMIALAAGLPLLLKRKRRTSDLPSMGRRCRCGAKGGR
jgi:T5SS/PEP-CTERM-associated repeat protein